MKSLKGKLCNFVLILLLLLTVVSPSSVYAVPSAVTVFDSVETVSDQNIETEFSESAEAALPSYIPGNENEAELFSEDFYSYVAENLAVFNTEIDVSQFGYKNTTAGKAAFCDDFGNVLRMDPGLYYVSYEFSFSYNSKKQITKLKPKYLSTDIEEISEIQGRIKARIEEIASLTDDSMTDIEKLVTIYNELALTGTYDHTLEKRRAKDLLLDGETVCQGYASALYAIAKTVGLEGGFVRSEEMNHVWNAFCIDDVWYHVDLTGGDPFEKYSTQVEYDEFLKSDKYLEESGYEGFVKLGNDSDAKYDSFFWNDVSRSLMIPIDNCFYYINGSNIYSCISKYDFETGETEQIYTFSNLWHSSADNRYHWVGTFSGLAYGNNRLYFNTETEILSCNLDGSDVRVECTPENLKEQFITGCCREGNNIRYTVEAKETFTFVESRYLTLPEEDTKMTFQSSMQAFLTLEDEVTLGVGYKLEGMENIEPIEHFDRLGLLVWSADKVPDEDNATYSNCTNIMTNTLYNPNSQRFETKTRGIAAKNLGDRIAFRVYYLNDDGSYSYSRLITDYCPKTYCYNQINKYTDDEEYTALMASILNYGAAAQQYFDYNTENLMNSDLPDELKNIQWDSNLIRNDYSVPDEKDSDFVRNEAVISRGGSLSLEGALEYNFYSKVNFVPKSATIYYWTEDDIKAFDKMTLENASSSEIMTYSDTKDRYEGKYEGQAAKEMFKTIYACMVFEDENGNIINSGVIGYSPERFAYINQDGDEKESFLAKSLIEYGDAARTYFESQEA